MTREQAIEFIAQSVKSDVDMALVADAIKALEQEPRWIPVSERLPKNRGFYLVSTTDCITIMEFINGWISQNIGLCNGYVKAWMPLPQPYKAESEAAAKAKQADKKRFISADEAIELLPEGEYIHTFRQSGILIGADWLREEVIDLIRKSDCLELTGGIARKMDHGLAIYDHDAKMQSDILFVETDMEKLQALDPDEEAADGNVD